jgi:drug/metabolite transporter (DMT)-like permease
MIAATTCWSIAGVVTRQLESARALEITFWRSLFAAICMLLILAAMHRGRSVRVVRAMGWPGIASGLMWAVMFTFFMLALARTSTANTLVVMSVYPLLAAVLAWWFLKQHVQPATWLAIVIASLGIGIMFAKGVGHGSRDDVVGTLLASAVPIAAAINVILLRRYGGKIDLVPALLLGAIVSAVMVGPLAWPWQSSLHDVGWLAFLGFVQLGLPCVLMIWAARTLSAPEIALLSLLEVVQGPLWAWLGANERPPAATLVGGAIVLTALTVEQLWQRRG